MRFRRRSRSLAAGPEVDAAQTAPAAPTGEPRIPGDDGFGTLVHAMANLQAGIAALTETGRTLAASIEAQTVVLTRVLEALVDRERPPAPPGTGRPSGVLGGTVAAGRRAVHRLDGRAPGTDVEVRCVWDGGWVGGFEVVEVLECRDGVRFRLLRRSDRSVLPVLFDDHEVRVAPSVPLTGVGRQLDLTEPDLAGHASPESDTAIGAVDGHRPRTAGPSPTGPDGPPGTQPVC